MDTPWTRATEEENSRRPASGLGRLPQEGFPQRGAGGAELVEMFIEELQAASQ